MSSTNDPNPSRRDDVGAHRDDRVDETRYDDRRDGVRDGVRHDSYADGHRDAVPVDRAEVVAREREEHGGIKWGSAFFGFLTATGVTVLLIAIATAVGAGVGLANYGSANAAADDAAASADSVGLVSGIVLLVILLIAYYCGGYVAGRMARFDGVRQGLAVWLWAIIIAVILAVLTLVVGDQYNLDVEALPALPVSRDQLTTGGIIAALIVLAVTLGGAILGGLAGMRFHRRVDRTGLGA